MSKLKEILLFVVMIGVVTITFAACKDPEPPTDPQTQNIPLNGTGWKCLGFYDVDKKELQDLGPNDWKYTYIFHFDDSSYSNEAYTRVSQNYYSMNYSVDVSTSAIEFTNIVRVTLAMDDATDTLFINALKDARYFSSTEEELKLFYNNKKNYLLFNRIYYNWFKGDSYGS